MKKEEFCEIFGEINEKHIVDARVERKAKKTVWLKWSAMAACLCLVIGLAIPILNNGPSEPYQEELPPVAEELPPVIDEGPAGMDMPEVVIIEFNGVEYFVCSNDDKTILQECGIMVELNEDLAGDHVCYLGISDNRFVPVEKANASEANDIELFEYAPEPNENVYIMCRSGEYFAAVRMDGESYHGLID